MFVTFLKETHLKKTYSSSTQGPVSGLIVTLLASLALSACGGNNPASVPGAPGIGSASAGDGSASIVFSAPANSGSSTISTYTATCTGGSNTKTASGAASPLTVSNLTNGISYSCSVTATNAAGTGAASSSVSVTPVAATGGGTSTGGAIDPSKLPIGDGKFSKTTPAIGSVYVCYDTTSNGGASAKGPWFNADGSTWNSLSKISVQGAVSWTSSFLVSLGANLGITGNGLPSTPTGTFPISPSDPAFQYDHNPNSIQVANIAWGLPANPVVAAQPSCTTLGAIGVLLDGARLFNADDGGHRDAVAWEIQDACQGHPQGNGQYHHHSISSCLSQKDVAGQHSPLVGYIADGFGIYGNQGENGKPLTNADLDECHGHTHALNINGVTVNQYHYHKTKEFPYTIGCFKGTPVSIN